MEQNSQHFAKLPVDRTTMEPADTAEPLKIENADGTRFSITIGPQRFQAAARALAAKNMRSGIWEEGQVVPSAFQTQARAVFEAAGFTVNEGPNS